MTRKATTKRRSMTEVERSFRRDIKAVLSLFVNLWQRHGEYFSQNDLRVSIVDVMHEGYQHDLQPHEITITGFVEAVNRLVGGSWIEYTYPSTGRDSLKNAHDYYRLTVDPTKETITTKYLGTTKNVKQPNKVEDLPMTFNKNDISLISKLVEMKHTLGAKNFFMIVDSLR